MTWQTATSDSRPAGEIPPPATDGRGRLPAPIVFDQSDRPIGLLSDARVVSYHDYSELPLGIQAVEGSKSPFRGEIQVPRRLVRQQDPRIADQGPGDRRALHLAARQLPRAVPQPVAQPDHFQQPRRRLPELPAAADVSPDVFADHQRHQDVFQRRQLGQQVIELEDHPQVAVSQGVALQPGQMIDPLPVEVDFARVRDVERGQQMEQRALAGTALADNCQHLSLADRKAHPPQHRDHDGPFLVVLFQVHRRQLGGRIAAEMPSGFPPGLFAQQGRPGGGRAVAVRLARARPGPAALVQSPLAIRSAAEQRPGGRVGEGRIHRPAG